MEALKELDRSQMPAVQGEDGSMALEFMNKSAPSVLTGQWCDSFYESAPY